MVGRLRQQHKNGQFILSGKTKELYEKSVFPANLVMVSSEVYDMLVCH